MNKNLKKATIKSMSKLGRSLYYLGAFKFEKIKEDNFDIMVLATFRLYNPISWIMFILMFLAGVFFEGVPTTIKDFTISETIYVSKNLLK